METKPKSRRSRDGCLTCKTRRKKCDSKIFPCGNCQRLGLQCEADTKLVWEDDARRDGMRRRGPSRTAKSTDSVPSVRDTQNFAHNQNDGTTTAHFPSQHHSAVASYARDPAADISGWELVQLHRLSDWPYQLDQTEFQLLSSYAQRFSRIYPAFAGPSNPFLQVFIPLAMQSRTVLDAVLALSSVQTWENGSFSMEASMLRMRQQALRGCHHLITEVMSRPDIQEEIRQSSSISNALQTVAHKAPLSDGNQIIHLLATCGLLLLYEKLCGESQQNGTSHLQFFARLFPVDSLMSLTDANVHNIEQSHWNEAVQFLSNLFLYNDLVRATSFRTPTLSSFYLQGSTLDSLAESTNALQLSDKPDMGRYQFPSLVARISGGDLSVTDEDFASWDGRLDWFPSFALNPPQVADTHERLPTSDSVFVDDPFFRQLDNLACPAEWTESALTSELYRVAATVYRRQCVVRAQIQASQAGLDLQSIGPTSMGNLPAWAIQLVQLISMESAFQNTLLWPIAIIAKEVEMPEDRDYILSRLQSLEQTFKMKHFCVVREHLIRHWMMRDQGLAYEDEELVLFG